MSLVDGTFIRARMDAKDSRINRELAARARARAKGQAAALEAMQAEKDAVNPYAFGSPLHTAWRDGYAFEHWKAAHL